MVFVGLPVWDDLLRRPEHRALDRRIAVRVAIPPLTPRLARDYIEFRLAAAGGAVDQVMSAAAIRALIAACDGNPGRIHALADHAMGLGLANRHLPIAGSDIRAAQVALALAPARRGLSARIGGRRAAILGLVVALASALAIGWLVLHPRSLAVFSSAAMVPAATSPAANGGKPAAAP